jgi:hypothetical protein
MDTVQNNDFNSDILLTVYEKNRLVHALRAGGPLNTGWNIVVIVTCIHFRGNEHFQTDELI